MKKLPVFIFLLLANVTQANKLNLKNLSFIMADMLYKTQSESKITIERKGDKIQLKIYKAKSDEGVVIVSDSEGRTLIKEEMELNPNVSYYTFDISSFPKGKIDIIIKSEQEKITTEFYIK